MTKLLGIGVVGVGYAGARHAQALLQGLVPEARLLGVGDADPSRAAGFEAVFRGSTEQLLQLPELEAVVIATPHPSHAGLCERALLRGLSVLVEKPFAVHKAECERVLATHAALPERAPTRPGLTTRALLGVVHDYRVEPRFLWLKQVIAGQSLGRVLRFTWQATNFFRTQAYFSESAWRGRFLSEGGGVLVNQAPHLLDAIQWLFGMPARVWANCGFGRFHDIEVEDDVNALLEYGDGMRGTIQVSTGESPGTQRLDVSLDGGRVVIEGNEAVVERNSEFCRTYLARAQAGRPQTSTERFQLPWHGASGLGVLRNFVAAVQGREPLVCPAEEASREVELANAILWSALEERAVQLPLASREFEAALQRLRNGELRPRRA